MIPILPASPGSVMVEWVRECHFWWRLGNNHLRKPAWALAYVQPGLWCVKTEIFPHTHPESLGTTTTKLGSHLSLSPGASTTRQRRSCSPGPQAASYLAPHPVHSSRARLCLPYSVFHITLQVITNTSAWLTKTCSTCLSHPKRCNREKIDLKVKSFQKCKIYI